MMEIGTRNNSRAESHIITIVITTAPCLEVYLKLENSLSFYSAFKFYINKIRQNAPAEVD